MTTTGAPTAAPDALAGLIDLDHAATTPVRPEVLSAMAPFAEQRYGNPSGAHRLARDAVRALDEARERIAAALGCAPGEVVITSGGTESDNHAVAGGMPPRPGVPVCAATEHHAVLDTVRALDGRVVGVDDLGRVDPGELGATLSELGRRASVVSVMAANNETGVVTDLASVAEVVARHTPEVPAVPLHTDAVQAAAWLDPSAWAPADLISVSAHKLGGPKGVGALVVRHHVELEPLLHGGGQERGRRSGTVDVAGAVGLATALECVAADRGTVAKRVGAVRDRLRDRLVDSVDGLVVTVERQGLARGAGRVLPGILHVCIPGVESETLLFLLESAGVCASAASSCASGADRGSHVLAAMGVPADLAGGALRLSLGSDTTEDEVDRAAAAVADAVERLRSFP